MEQIAREYKDKGVEFYQFYTRELRQGVYFSKRSGDKRFDFSEKKQTKNLEEKASYADEMVKQWGQNRPALIDIFSKDCVQNWIGVVAPNSLALIDRDGRLVLWQVWSNPEEIRKKLDQILEDEKK